jgi:hypothetical protein
VSPRLELKIWRRAVTMVIDAEPEGTVLLGEGAEHLVLADLVRHDAAPSKFPGRVPAEHATALLTCELILTTIRAPSNRKLAFSGGDWWQQVC